MKGRSGGFTLLESIIVIGLLAIVGLSFAYLLTTSQRFLVQSTNAASSQTDASFAMEHIKRHLTVARDSVGVGGNVVSAIAQPAAGASGSVLEFNWQPRAADPLRTSRYVLQGTDLRFIPDITAAGTFEVIAQGRMAHGSMPYLGISAIEGMSHLLDLVRDELGPALFGRGIIGVRFVVDDLTS